MSAAVLSDCETYRYALWRDTGVIGGVGTVLFVGLNPSTADATLDDPTIRRCVGFVRDWGYARLAMGNLYAYRSTSPAQLGRVDDPIGPENDDWLERLASEASLTIAAWGAAAFATAEREGAALVHLGATSCLALTKHNRPQHPLYVPKAANPLPYTDGLVLTHGERQAIRDRDGWRCTQVIEPRAHNGRTFGHRGRCPVMGSEMVVYHGVTLCPRHARDRADREEAA